MINRDLRTWVEIDETAVQSNARLLRSIIGPRVKLWAVVKSNAYGHGIFDMPPLLSKTRLIYGFCVDSLVEGVKLREMGIKEPILVLGLTLPKFWGLAAENKITVTISNFDVLDSFLDSKEKPFFHLKIDTGMHRQGFYVEDLHRVFERLKKMQNSELLSGIYTHFASAKDLNYPGYTDKQFEGFQAAIKIAAKAGFKNLMRHAAATGGALINKKYHLDAVRIGIGLYGLWPSKELEIQMPQLTFHPVLSWKTVVGEIKDLRRGDFVGYDLVERVSRDSKIAVLPLGYWHGFPRSLSSTGEVLVGNKRARVLGRVSMDMIVVDITGIKCKYGDEAVVIGGAGEEYISASEVAAKAGTSAYEIVTRINPLTQRVIWKKDR